MRIVETGIEGLVVIEPTVYRDERGFLVETFQAERYRGTGVPLEFVQSNQSRSTRGVLRGLHFQKRTPQGKLVRCSRGAVFDVAVDLRPASPTFGKWHSQELDDETHRQVYIPEGFAHGFQVLSEIADVEYQCTAGYDPEDQHGVRWSDEELAIPWPIADAAVNARDRDLPPLREILGS